MLRIGTVVMQVADLDWASYPAGPDLVVLADPEGNRFCVIDTSRGTP